MRNDLYQQIGRQIKRAREALDISQGNLASQIGYSSPATISHFETGQRKINIEDLQKISSVLGLQLDSLLNMGQEIPDFSKFHVLTRSVRPPAREEVANYLVFAQKHAKKAKVLPEEVKLQNPGQAAEIVLNNAGQKSPPVSPEEVSANLGIPVFYWDFSDEISGIYITEDDKSSIGINSEHPKVRQRFSLAHELGHFIFHGDQAAFLDFNSSDSNPSAFDIEKQQVETRANQFAADLLMPKEWITRDISKYGEDNLQFLSQRYEVSEQALWYRLLSLKLVERNRK